MSGLYTASLLPLAMVRGAIVRLTANRSVEPSDQTEVLVSLSRKQLFIYLAAGIVLHHAMFFFLETMSFTFFWQTAGRIFAGSALAPGTRLAGGGMVHVQRIFGAMKFERASLQRYATLRWIVAAVFVALALRLCYIQLIDTKYKDLATSNIIRRVVEYPRAARCSTDAASIWCRAASATTSWSSRARYPTRVSTRCAWRPYSTSRPSVCARRSTRRDAIRGRPFS